MTRIEQIRQNSVALRTLWDTRDAALRTLVEQWREMAKLSFADGPIPGDEIGHAARWTAVEMSADALDAILKETTP